MWTLENFKDNLPVLRAVGLAPATNGDQPAKQGVIGQLVIQT